MTYSQKFLELVGVYKKMSITYPNLKSATLAQWILESGRGSSQLAEVHNNFAGMKWRSVMQPYAKRVPYEASDGQGYYCAFSNLENFVEGYWKFLERTPYRGWETYADEGDAFIEFIGPVWAEDRRYVEKVINLIDEATDLLENIPPVSPSEEPDYRDEDGEMSRGTLVSGRARIVLDPTGDIARGRDGLEIEYRGDPSCPYGRTATSNKRDFVAIVTHHTSPDHDTDWYVKYQIDGDDGRGGHHYGYHFYISLEGRIVQGAPLGKRTNHIKSPQKRVRKDFGRIAANNNSIGVTCVGAAQVSRGRTIGSRPTPDQTEAVYKLVYALCDLYSIRLINVYGHGEIQGDRHEEEGRELAREIRSWNESDS